MPTRKPAPVGKLIKQAKDFPIYAGMKFTYPGETDLKMHIIGYYTMQFTYSADGALLSEKKIKTTLNHV